MQQLCPDDLVATTWSPERTAGSVGFSLFPTSYNSREPAVGIAAVHKCTRKTIFIVRRKMDLKEIKKVSFCHGPVIKEIFTYSDIGKSFWLVEELTLILC